MSSSDTCVFEVALLNPVFEHFGRAAGFDRCARLVLGDRDRAELARRKSVRRLEAVCPGKRGMPLARWPHPRANGAMVLIDKVWHLRLDYDCKAIQAAGSDLTSVIKRPLELAIRIALDMQAVRDRPLCGGSIVS